ncbi:putative protein kinase CAMK-CAMKL-CHK1 family [Rosa chinensis]|uniref:Protein kinase domain-containing protein n=1 Tax=Rosa chinensis TaxID=74649 RepID=A0A2P6RP73_ROSCH|nr:putative protein kinase CAMK-CAMKL-CHK1 family [Rosa chinensis]
MHMVITQKGNRDYSKKRIQVGKYELGKTLGEGSFGKVKFATNVESGQPFAVKILERKRIIDLNMANKITREIETLKLLKHPNVVRLHEIVASKTQICMVLEYVEGGDLFDKIRHNGRVTEAKGRKLFQQLIDGVSYCHNKGVYHRDLKLENILLDEEGNIKICDFGLSALPQHLKKDGLLHTICGTPNYVAPEILINRGYNGATADTWSCGVILFAILSGFCPFDDKNLAVLYHKIYKGNFKIPDWLSPGAKSLIRRILDPNPVTRINMRGIKSDEWFNQDYTPAKPDEDEEEGDIHVDDEEALKIPDLHCSTVKVPGFLRALLCCFGLCVSDVQCNPNVMPPPLLNAYEFIGFFSCLDLSGFFWSNIQKS